ncbi:MAG: bifunctional oligoribonuclease/PAP phosphatase NrnA, partial [Desulfovibrionaceae bacterium]
HHIVHLLAQHDRFLIAAHANPDGDALGACSAMGYILQSMGKKFTIYNESALPASFDWLPLPCPLCHDVNQLPFTPELAIILDCGDMHRVGSALSAQLPALASINIDHHMATPAYGNLYNWIDPSMAATGQMVAHIATAAGIPLTGPLAENIFVAIVTDTGSFSHSNTSAAVFRLAAEMLENGLDIATLRENMENRLNLSGLRLQGELLLRFSLYNEGRAALVCVTQEDLHKHHASKEDIEGIINRLRQVRGVLIAAVLREDGPAQCKLSLRSSGSINVRSIAATMGGGGHRNASGASIAHPLEDACALTLAALNTYFATAQPER